MRANASDRPGWRSAIASENAAETQCCLPRHRQYCRGKRVTAAHLMYVNNAISCEQRPLSPWTKLSRVVRYRCKLAERFGVVATLSWVNRGGCDEEDFACRCRCRCTGCRYCDGGANNGQPFQGFGHS